MGNHSKWNTECYSLTLKKTHKGVPNWIKHVTLWKPTVFEYWYIQTCFSQKYVTNLSYDEWSEPVLYRIVQNKLHQTKWSTDGSARPSKCPRSLAIPVFLNCKTYPKLKLWDKKSTNLNEVPQVTPRDISKIKQHIYGISTHVDGGPRSPSAHAGPFARPPISTSGNFLAHVSAESPSNISPNPSEVISEVSEP